MAGIGDEEVLASADQAYEGLQHLRGGIGLVDPEAGERLTARQRDLLGFPTSGGTDARFEWAWHAVHLAGDLIPEEDLDLIGVAFNEARSAMKWTHRVAGAADRRGVSARTVIRKTDAAFEIMAAALIEERFGLGDEDLDDDDGLQVLKRAVVKSRHLLELSCEATVAVEAETVTVNEARVVQAKHNGLLHYVVAKNFPWPETQIESQAYEGAEVLAIEQPNESYFLELLRLTPELAAGQKHRFAVEHVTSDMAPMYTVTPVHPLKHLTVTVRFRAGTSGDVWGIDGVPPGYLRGRGLVDAARKVGSPLDQAGNAYQAKFTGMRSGLSYGVVWSIDESDNS